MANSNYKPYKSDKQSKRKPQWNAGLSGEMRVFVHRATTKTKGDFNTFSVSVGRKQMDSAVYDNIYFDVTFPKDKTPFEIPVDDGSIIVNVKDAFITVRAYDAKDGHRVVTPSVHILDYELA